MADFPAVSGNRCLLDEKMSSLVQMAQNPPAESNVSE